MLLREGRGRSERVDVGERGLDHLETRRLGAHQVRQLGAHAALLRLLVLRRQQQRLLSSTANSGSRKTVSPDWERSWMTPATVCAADVRNGTTKRPFRSVT
jgi:hypothetical protein